MTRRKMMDTASQEKLEGHTVRLPARVWRALERRTPSRDWPGAVKLVEKLAEEFVAEKNTETMQPDGKVTMSADGKISLGEF